MDGMVLHSAVEGVQFGGGLQSFDGLHARFPSQFVILWDAGSLCRSAGGHCTTLANGYSSASHAFV